MEGLQNLLNYGSLRTELQIHSICEFKEFHELILRSKVIGIKISYWVEGHANWIVWELWNFFSLREKYIMWQLKYLKITLVSKLCIVSPYFNDAVLSLSSVTPPKLHIYVPWSYPSLMQCHQSGKRINKTDFAKKYIVTQTDKESILIWSLTI